MVIQAVLFDYGGTLDSNGIPWLDRFYPHYQQAGIHVPKDVFAKAFYASDDHLPRRHRLDGLGLEQTVRIQVLDVLSAIYPEGPHQRQAEAVTQAFIAESRRHFKQIRPFLERLNKKYPLGIVSNFYGNLSSVLKSEGLLELFQTVADSSVVGHLKPSPEIFVHALHNLGADPAQTWMVGDSIPRDMRGAEKLGMPHAWLRSDLPNTDSEICCGKAKALQSILELENYLMEPTSAVSL